jgi:oxaloacetate decarboxylase alpha subunit
VKLKADFISIKDPTGLLTPERGRTLFPAVVKAAGSVPLKLHSHCQSGLAPEVYEIAIRSGFRYGYTASEPLANGASLPATEDIGARARKLGFRTSLDAAALREIAGYFTCVAEREGKPLGQVARYDPALYEHQIPGGMISNLRSQLQAMNMEHRLPEILEEVPRVREDLGYPIVVSPFAQYVVTQATLNVVQGERYKTIPDEIRKYAMGYYGKLAAQPSAEFLERAAIRPGDLVTERPGEHIEPWIPRLRKALGPSVPDEDLLLAAFYPKPLLEPLKKRAPEYEFRTTPLNELIRFIGSRGDIEFAHVRFAGTEMSFSA